MNKNDFMKAMSMIDEDLIHEAGGDDISKAVSGSHEDTAEVSGVEIYHRTARKKLLAAAVTLVIAGGAVAGGAYCFSRLMGSDNNNIAVSDSSSESEYVEDVKQYDSIYGKLRAYKDNCIMKVHVRTFDNVEDTLRMPGDSECKKDFFDYMDALGMENKAMDLISAKTVKSLEFEFYPGSGGSVIYCDMYSNGYCVWTDKTGDEEQECCYWFDDGEKIFHDFLERYSIDEHDVQGWDTVSKSEIEDVVFEAYYASSNMSSFRWSGSTSVPCATPDQEKLSSIISSFDWVRADGFDQKNYYSIYGMLRLSEEGFLGGTHKGYSVDYKLKNDADLETFREKVKELGLDFERSDDPTALLKKYESEDYARWFEGSMDNNFDRKRRYYSVPDAKAIMNGLAALEWVACDGEEIDSNTGHYEEDGEHITNGYYEIGPGELFYGSNLRIYPDGYISIDDQGGFKLKNEDNVEKLKEIIDQNMVMCEGSKVAELICSGMTDYINLKAHYTYETKDDSGVVESMTGYLYVDAVNEKMYMNGEGTYHYPDLREGKVEIAMNGHDDSAVRMVNKATGKTDFIGLCSYIIDDSIPSPGYHYIYICKYLEETLSDVTVSEDSPPGYSVEKREADGNTEIIIGPKNEKDRYSLPTYTILITLKGQLLSYECREQRQTVSFKLDDYNFDSAGFMIDEVGAAYESIKKEVENR